MTTGGDIKTHFYLPNQEEYECAITILMESKDSELMHYLHKQICFEVEDGKYRFEGAPIVSNTCSLLRKIYVKKN